MTWKYLDNWTGYLSVSKPMNIRVCYFRSVSGVMWEKERTVIEQRMKTEQPERVVNWTVPILTWVLTISYRVMLLAVIGTNLEQPMMLYRHTLRVQVGERPASI